MRIEGGNTEAKDTVMSREQASEVIDSLPPNELFGYILGDRQPWKFIAEVQAEISFKAGIREVVEWIEKNTTVNIPNTEDYCKEWQAFKESKGIKE